MSGSVKLFLLIASAAVSVATGAAIALDTKPEGAEALSRLTYANDRSAKAALKRAVSAFASNCSSVDHEADEIQPIPLTRGLADASVACSTPSGQTGNVDASQFSSRKHMESYVNAWKPPLQSPVGACDVGPGTISWADKDGRTRGTILCGITNNGQKDDRATLVWTDTRALRVFVVNATDYAAAIKWFDRSVRGRTAPPPELERRVLRYIGELADNCEMSAAGDVLAMITVGCDDPSAGDTLQIKLFFTRQQLSEFYETLAAQYVPAPTGGQCVDSQLTSGNWATEGKRRGELLCFPYSYKSENRHRQWAAWTLEKRRLALLVSERTATSQAAFDAFSDLAGIGL